MKTKQLIGIVVTGAVIIAVGVSGVISNTISQRILSENVKDETSSAWQQILDGDVSGEITLPEKEFIGVVNVIGEIGENTNSYFSTSKSYNHEQNLKFIDAMETSIYNKGIFLYVDSPGGAVYQSDELYQKLLEYKETTKRPIWAYFASEACSGGYYVSMAADRIFANRNTWTGSIGVIISLINCKELYDKLGIKEIDITSGKNKAMGALGKDLTKEQTEILQRLVDEAYDQFIEIVALGRNLDESAVRKLADGRIYSAKQAKENNLIDEIDTIENVKAAFTNQLETTKNIQFFTPKKTWGDIVESFFEKADSIMPKSDIDMAKDIVENQGNGVLKYYAE